MYASINNKEEKGGEFMENAIVFTPQIIETLIIMAVMIACFVTEVIPLAVTGVLAALSFAVLGIIPFGDAYYGFATSTIMLMVGAAIVGQSLFESGAAELMGRGIVKIVGINERKMIFALMMACGIMSMFCSNIGTLSLFIPLGRSVAMVSGGKIKSRNLTFPLAIAVIAGGSITIFGSTPQLIPQGLLQDAGYAGFGTFELGIVAVPTLLFATLFCSTFGYKWMSKNFENVPELESKGNTDINAPIKTTPQTYLSIVGLLFMIVGLVAGWWTNGAVCLVAAAFVICTKCLSFKTATNKAPWSAIIVTASTLGVAKGMTASGTDLFLANIVFKIVGNNPSPWLVVGVLGLLVMILGNFISHSGTMSLLTPIFIPAASLMGLDVHNTIYVLAVFIAICYATPLATTTQGLTLTEGYKFSKHYTPGFGLMMNVCNGLIAWVICSLRFVLG
jgi:di/tricarboxylate transporter